MPSFVFAALFIPPFTVLSQYFLSVTQSGSRSHCLNLDNSNSRDIAPLKRQDSDTNYGVLHDVVTFMRPSNVLAPTILQDIVRQQFS